jgi:hypothetical protein
VHSAADKTPHVADEFRVGSKCEASECLLIGKDLWARGRGKVYMNPRVRVYYNAETVFWQQWVLPAFNRWFFAGLVLLQCAWFFWVWVPFPGRDFGSLQPAVVGLTALAAVALGWTALRPARRAGEE